MKIHISFWLSDLALQTLKETMTQEQIAAYYKDYVHRQSDRAWQFERIRSRYEQSSHEIIYSAEIPDEEYIWSKLGGTWQ